MHRGLRRRMGAVVSIVLVVGALGATTSTPASALDPERCRAQVFRPGVGLIKEYTDFQVALNSAAPSGDRIRLSGRCVGNFKIGDTGDITITPIPANPALPPDQQPTPPVLRAPVTGGRVLLVPAGRAVTLQSLTIRGGDVRDKTGVAGWGGGIRNVGVLDLDDVIVRGNKAVHGGGISNGFKLLVTGDSRIFNNTATQTGGGIQSESSTHPASTVVTDDSRIDHNSADQGGGIYGAASKVILNGKARVHDNQANFGGGIATQSWSATQYSTFFMRGSSEVDDNQASQFGAALNLEGVTTLMDNAWVHDNDISSVAQGGAVEIFSYGTATSFTMQESSLISDNQGGPGGGAVVSWQDCGSTPVLSGLGPRVVENTPANVVLRTGSDAC